MREKLKDINGSRQRFNAVFQRFGQKVSFGYTKTTVLFLQVKNAKGEVVADHIWFTMNKQFKELDLKEGDRVSFEARVKPYIKGYRGNREDEGLPPLTKDYKLSHPKKVEKHSGNGNQLSIFT